MLLRKLVRTAWNYRSQFLSMIIMIAIGIGIFLGFNIEWHSIESDTSAFFEDTKYADYRIYSENGFTEDEIEAIQEIEGVKAATRYLAVNVTLKDTKKTVSLNVSEDYNVSTMLVTSGNEYEEEQDGIWLSDRFAEENEITLGDNITLVYQGIEIREEVVGLCKSGENMICVADSNQLMPDYVIHGFAYISPETLEKSLGSVFYPQINIISDMEKEDLEAAVRDAVGKTLQVTDKELHTAYAGAKSEAEEGKTMGSVLPVLFLAIAVLTMVTTMHRIAANEKVQIGTLKALGFRDSRILLHYTSYGFFIGIIGCLLGIAMGYGVAAFIMNPNGMMGTYFDLLEWKLTMPAFCIPVIVFTIVFLTLISFLSTKKMLLGTAADALRPYTPKPMKKSSLEKWKVWKNLSFSLKWNLRDMMRHKTRSVMTLLGIFGCLILIVGGLGMKDTMDCFLDLMDDTCNYTTKVNTTETGTNEEIQKLCDTLEGDWQSSVGISYDGDPVALDIYHVDNGNIRFLNKKNETFELGDQGVYLCLRLQDTAQIGDTIEIAPYGSEEIYQVKVAGYFRSLVSESIAMSADYADKIGMDYHISSIYTDINAGEIEGSNIIAGKQEKETLMESYDTFLEIMNLMVFVLIVAAAILGIIVLYNLGVMSYVERYRELATLKVLGFRDKAIGKLLISQNIWLTLLGVLIGLLGGYVVLYVLIKALASEYELSITIKPFTYVISALLTFVVSWIVGVMVARKNKAINMVEALKDAE